MATWVISLLIVAAVYFAARKIIRANKEGGCVGCSGGSCCGGCNKVTLPKK
ncbi:MAG: FeoB-associated Cys-rich membrane protein [Acidaminococcaceae bacterium]|nr:FeoB-associated Cys-rich membrane protein [Acidaminococcaceae bacterium]